MRMMVEALVGEGVGGEGIVIELLGLGRIMMELLGLGGGGEDGDGTAMGGRGW